VATDSDNPRNNEVVHRLCAVAESALWDSAKKGDPQARERLIEGYLDYARIIAAKLYSRRIDSDLEFAEYLQFATVGLIEAVDRFDPTKNIQFKTFAGLRVHGAVLSGLEQLSEKRVQISTRTRLQAERKDSAKMADQQPNNTDVFQRLADVAVSLAIGYLLDNPAAEADAYTNIGFESHYTSIELHQLQEKIRALVENLPQRERIVIKYHYLNQIPFNVIAENLGISKGRVSQIHCHALQSLREAIKAINECDAAW